MLAFFKRWLGGKPAAVRSVPFSGAQIGRLTATLPSFSQSINADLDGTLVILRSRARNLCANHEYGRRFLSMVATNVVGAYGPTLQVRAYNTPTGKGAGTLDKPANAAIELHWKRWGKRCDIAGRLTLPQLLRVAMKSVARDGEVLIRIVRRRDLPYGLALQLLEADRLDESINRTLAGGNIVRQGVEVDPQQRRVAYYIRTNHPGDRYSQPKNDIERVPASDVFHLFVPERAEQLRGYTWLHAVLMRAQMLQPQLIEDFLVLFIERRPLAAIHQVPEQEQLPKMRPSRLDQAVVDHRRAGEGSTPVLAQVEHAVDMAERHALVVALVEIAEARLVQRDAHRLAEGEAGEIPIGLAALVDEQRDFGLAQREGRGVCPAGEEFAQRHRDHRRPCGHEAVVASLRA